MNANQVIAGLGLALAAVSSQAATSFFTSEAAFNASVASFGPRTVETYEAPAPSSTATSQDFGAFTFSCDGSAYCPGFYGRWTILASEGAYSVYGATPDKMRFTFDAPINVFATDLIGLADVGATTFSVALSNGDGTDLFVDLVQPGGTKNFVGISSSVGFTSITFSGTQANDGVAYDRTQFAAVPEPESYALLIAGLATAGVLARRRRG